MTFETMLLLIFNGVMAFGALMIVWQIRLTKKQASTTFEDALNREYREIIHKIPPKALLGELLTEDEIQENLEDFLYYVDLSNEQAFLRANNRVGVATWRNWSDGMRSNFNRPGFSAAWELIKTKSPGDFAELRRLEMERFAGDPRKWNKR